MAASDAATVTFAWTLSGPAPSLGGVPFPGRGTITASVSAGGADTVTGITGIVNGGTIAGLNTFDGADNLLFPTGTKFLSTDGISFVTVAGQDINIFSFFPQSKVATLVRRCSSGIAGNGADVNLTNAASGSTTSSLRIGSLDCSAG